MTSKQYMRDITVIDAVWLPELAPRYYNSTTNTPLSSLSSPSSSSPSSAAAGAAATQTPLHALTPQQRVHLSSSNHSRLSNPNPHASPSSSSSLSSSSSSL